ncbi:MAG: chromosomal replication initiator protein DnaA [Gaiellales bacterium]|nr:chromosomal replication initiator protein DnaA [Gaiellales bacterium]
METHHADLIWQEALALLSQRVNEGTYRIWFAPTVGLGFKDETFLVGVGSEFARDWIQTRFAGLIGECLSQVLGDHVLCHVVVSDEVADTHVSPPSSPGSPPPTVVESSTDPQVPSSPSSRLRGLNERYTFESFVTGPSNRFAQAAALAAAESPGTAYNPLFIYGGVGLGKTHLLQAIGHYVLRNSPELRVRFLTIELFTNDFINSLRDEKIEGFKRRYRENDVLLIDDVQFLERKEQTQEEFFHTFNSLYEAGKQIVLTCDRHPKALKTLEDRLVSRFSMGLITDIQAPDLETRIAILRKRVQHDGLTVTDDEVLTLIATRVPANVRELEGCLTRVAAFASFTGRPVDLALARDVLKDIPEGAGVKVTVEHIISVVCQATGISHAEVVGDKRSRPIVHARHLAMYLARELTDVSLPQIGERFGGRDHTTVLHAVDKLSKLLHEDRGVYDQIQQLTTRIKTPK